MNGQSALQQRFEREQAMQKVREANAAIEQEQQAIAKQEEEQRQAQAAYEAQLKAYNEEQQAIKNAERAFEKRIPYSFFAGMPEYKYLKEMYKDYNAFKEANWKSIVAYREQEAKLDKAAAQLNMSREEFNKVVKDKENVLVTDEAGKYSIMKKADYDKLQQEYADWAATQQSRIAPQINQEGRLPFKLPIYSRPTAILPERSNLAQTYEISPQLRQTLEQVKPKEPYKITPARVFAGGVELAYTPIKAGFEAVELAGRGTEALIKPYAEYGGLPMSYKKEIPAREVVLPYQQRGTMVTSPVGDYNIPTTKIEKSYETKPTLLGIIPKAASLGVKTTLTAGAFTYFAPVMPVAEGVFLAKGVQSGIEIAQKKSMETGEKLSNQDYLPRALDVGLGIFAGRALAKGWAEGVIAAERNKLLKRMTYKPEIITEQKSFLNYNLGINIADKNYGVSAVTAVRSTAYENVLRIDGKRIAQNRFRVIKDEAGIGFVADEEGRVIATPAVAKSSDKRFMELSKAKEIETVGFSPEQLKRLPRSVQNVIVGKDKQVVMTGDNIYMYETGSISPFARMWKGKRAITIKGINKKPKVIGSVSEEEIVLDIGNKQISRGTVRYLDITNKKSSRLGKYKEVKGTIVNVNIKSGEAKNIDEYLQSTSNLVQRAALRAKKATPLLFEAMPQVEKRTINIFKKGSSKNILTEPRQVAEVSVYTGLGTYERTEATLSRLGQRETGVEITSVKPKESIIEAPRAIVKVVQREELVAKPQEKYSNTFLDKTDEAFRFKEAAIQRPLEKISEGQAQVQKQKQITRVEQAQVTTPIRPPTPIQPPAPIRKKFPIRFNLGTEKTKSILSKVKQAFNVVVFRKGKEEVIAKNLPAGMAKKRGVKEVLSSLRASFKLKPSGTTSMEDIEYNIPEKLFTKSKFDKERFVQRKTTRFGTRRETKEAQIFRKKKAGRIKWF